MLYNDCMYLLLMLEIFFHVILFCKLKNLSTEPLWLLL